MNGANMLTDQGKETRWEVWGGLEVGGGLDPSMESQAERQE